MYYHVISMESDIDRGVCLLLSCVQLFVNLWTVAHQALLSPCSLRLVRGAWLSAPSFRPRRKHLELGL